MRKMAFLRGINISGKNKIQMADLKAGFEAIGCREVKTVLNSGNVCFTSGMREDDLARQLEAMIQARFDLNIPVFVIAKQALADILHSAPAWWGSADQAVYDNLIFVLPPTHAADVVDALGEPKEGLEQIKVCGEVIFWSFSRKDYQKTNWWKKTASDAIGSRLTIRTAATVRKMAGM